MSTSAATVFFLTSGRLVIRSGGAGFNNTAGALMMTILYDRVRDLMSRATALASADGVLPNVVPAADVPLERPRQVEHGDLATNLCFTQARAARTNPRKLADSLVPYIKAADTTDMVAAAEVAGPGFINLRLSGSGWQGAIIDALRTDSYGHTTSGAGERVLIEFVSANPTGPLHVGHGRGAVLGDGIARVMRAAGYDVTTEYYINNVGNQIAMLGQSLWLWCRELAPLSADARTARADAVPLQLPAGFPEDGYRGNYIAQAAVELLVDDDVPLGLDAPSWQDDAWWAASEPANRLGRADNRAVSIAAWRSMLDGIREDLNALDISFDRFFSERALHGLESLDDGEPDDLIAGCIGRLRTHDWAFVDEEKRNDHGAPTSFRGTREDIPKKFRDTKDRVIVRSDGRPTYFAADIAYHDHKLRRGFDHMIDVLGADHHGYVPRLKGVIEALGDVLRGEGDPNAGRWSGDRLEVQLVQMVALLRDGKPVQMGKRSGEFVTLRAVVDEVSTSGTNSGRDAVRFIFLTRKPEAQLDFDLEVARRTSMDNPVYYVQYGHARLASIIAKAREQGIELPDDVDASPLDRDDERLLAMTIAGFPEVVTRAAQAREPHQIAFFLMDTCKQFHGYYSRGKVDGRVITDDRSKTLARLALIAALKSVLANGLAMLGVTAPDRMVSLTAQVEA
jgi:arginyl-tRNA synthetase